MKFFCRHQCLGLVFLLSWLLQGLHFFFAQDLWANDFFETSYERRLLESLRKSPERNSVKGVQALGKVPLPVPQDLLRLMESKNIQKELSELTHNEKLDRQFQEDLAKNIFQDSPQEWGRIDHWKSGGNNFRRFHNQEISQYLEKVFHHLVQKSREQGQKISINRSDLYHGHMIYDQRAKDILIIFHAKEYPMDLEYFKAHACATSLGEAVFYSTDSSYKKRNFLFSLGENFLWNIDTSVEGPLKDLIFPPELPDLENDPELKLIFERGNTLQNSRFESLGGPLGDLNYFPGENVAPFISQFAKEDAQ